MARLGVLRVVVFKPNSRNLSFHDVIWLIKVNLPCTNYLGFSLTSKNNSFAIVTFGSGLIIHSLL